MELLPNRKPINPGAVVCNNPRCRWEIMPGVKKCPNPDCGWANPAYKESEAGREARIRYDGYPIFVGALAVCKSASLVTSELIFTDAMVAAKASTEVPQRFRPAVDHLKVLPGQTWSTQAEHVTSELCRNKLGIIWKAYGRQLEYHMADDDALKYIQKMSFSEAELDWLWQFAQTMHAGDKPVEKRW